MTRTTALIALLVLFQATQADEVLPVEAFASLPHVSNVLLSPNGENVAFLIKVDLPEAQGAAVRVINLEAKKATTVTYGETEDFVINWIRWANDEQLLVSARFPANRQGVPTTETRLIVVDIHTTESRSAIPSSYLRNLNRVPQIQDDIVDLLPDEPDTIMLQGRFSSTGRYAIVTTNLNKARVRTVERGHEDVIHWVTDRQHRPRIAIRRDDTTYTVSHQDVDGDWSDLWEYEAFAEDEVWPMSFDEDPDILYVRAYHEGLRAVFKVRLSDPLLEKQLVFANPHYDVNGSLIYAKSGSVIGIRFDSGGGFTFWDEDHKRLQSGVNEALPDTTNVIYSLSDDERRYIVMATSDTNPGTFYVGNRDENNLMYFSKRYPDLPEDALADKLAISYKARDGLEIAGFLTLPPNTSGPRPAIVFPHGGPISFDDGGFDYWTQYFANRGYAVLQMNFRGSAGYGYDFMASGLQGWGLEMQNDVEDGTRWLIEEGIADPERICIVGASYGGYAALMEAARNPDLYRCAVSFAGVTDVAYLVSSSSRYSNYEVVREQIGSDYKELRRRSPLHNADDIRIPVLLGHGTDDRSVRVRHSKRMHKALRKAGADVAYLELDGGDHYLSQQDHRIAFFQAMDEFLGEHLQTNYQADVAP